MKEVDLVLAISPGWGVIQPPVGISYLKSFLSKNGIGVKCLDLNLDFYRRFSDKRYWNLNYPEYFVHPGLFNRYILPLLRPFIDIWAEKILQLRPRAVGFSLFMSSLNVSLLLSRRLKELSPSLIILGGGAEVNRFKTAVGGNTAHTAPVDMDIYSAFDTLIYGEGEHTLLEVISLLKQGEDFHKTDGIIYAEEDEITVNSPRSLINDIDRLPAPDYSDFELDFYTEKTLPIVTSRGCVNHCTFCADSPLWKIYRRQSAEKVFEDLKFLAKRYNKSLFEFVDSTFNGDIRRVGNICDLIIRRNLDIKWSAKVTLSIEMNQRLLDKMKRAGCDSLAYGVESASPRVLKDMRKNFDIEEAKEIIRATHRTGIDPKCFFIIGYPTESEEDFQMTLDFIGDMKDYIYRFDQITGCHIEDDSYLGLNPDKYGIVFKEDGWHSRESTPRIRQERLRRFRELAGELHKHYQCEVQM